MRVAGIEEFGGNVTVLEVPDPRAPRAGEVLIEVKAAGVGNWDEFARCVARPDHPLVSLEPGSYGLADLADHQLAVFEWNEEVDDLRERLRIVGGRDALAGFVKVSPAAVARRLVLDEGISCLLPVLTVQRDLERGELIPLEPEGAVSYSGS